MKTIFRTGIGYDVHALVEDRKLMIGGVEIPHERGLLGHSDADVLIHAIMDALLGAAALPDIGTLFPDTEAEYKDIDSTILLRRVDGALKDKGFVIENIDSVVMAQRPKLMPHIPEMRRVLSEVLGLDEECIGIKATTTEWLGFEGREEGISAQAVCLISKEV